MATRRIVASDKTILDQDEHPDESSNITPAVPRDVIFKLLAFTVAMVFFPIGSYFATVNLVFRGNSSYAGGFAAIIANVVLITYIVVAMNEDQSEQQGKKNGKKPETKKDL